MSVARGVGWLHALLLFVCVPALASAFALPKLAVLVAGAAVMALAALRTDERSGPFSRKASRLALALLALVAISALASPAARAPQILLWGAGLILLIALLQRPLDVPGVQRTLARLGAAQALVVCLQAIGLDPVLALGAALGRAPLPMGARMSVIGTLGNPDFVAAWLSASLCLAVGEAGAAKGRARLAWWSAALLHVAALAACRSFATLGALCVAALAGAIVSQRRGAIATFALAIALALAAGVSARDPARALAGRAHLWRIGLAQLGEAPLLGHGPGSVETLEPRWEASLASAGASLDPRALGRQDHLHADALEIALELGLPALALALGLLTLAVLGLWRRRAQDPLRSAALLAALGALSSRSLVDFPLARPAELALFVTLLALALARTDTAQAAPEPSPLPYPALEIS